MTDEQQRQLAQWKQRAEDRIGALDNALAAMTARAEQAEAELRESERDLSDMAANSNRLHAIAEQMRQRVNTVVAEYSERLVAATQRAEAAEAKLAAVPVEAIAVIARGMAQTTPTPSPAVAEVLYWLHANRPQETQPDAHP